MATAHLRVSSEDRRQQILEVASGLFARQGFEGTTTRQIAQSARVNEAIIFRHFPSKDELYWAVIEHKCASGGGKPRLQELLSSGRSEREVFESIAEDYLRRRAEDPSMTRLLLFSALERHELSERFFRAHIAEFYEMLAEYIRQRIAQGRFRKTDPVLAARSYLGMVVYHFLVQELFGGSAYRQYDPQQVAKTIAGIWLEGMLPNGHKSEEQGQKKPQRAQRRTQ
jgi:AcrR family transcriptional regulator